jgi:hypothetical protein
LTLDWSQSSNFKKFLILLLTNIAETFHSSANKK